MGFCLLVGGEGKCFYFRTSALMSLGRKRALVELDLVQVQVGCVNFVRKTAIRNSNSFLHHVISRNMFKKLESET